MWEAHITFCTLVPHVPRGPFLGSGVEAEEYEKSSFEERAGKAIKGKTTVSYH